MMNEGGTLSLCVLTVTIIWAACRLNSSRRLVDVIPGPKSTSWIYGNLPELLLSSQYGEHEFQWHEMYGQVYSIKGCFGQTRLIISDPSTIKYILNNDVSVHGPSHAKVSNTIFGRDNVFIIQGHAHRHLRNIMNPSFSPNNIRGLLPVIRESGRKLADRWETLGFVGSTVNIAHTLNAAADAHQYALFPENRPWAKLSFPGKLPTSRSSQPRSTANEVIGVSKSSDIFPETRLSSSTKARSSTSTPNWDEYSRKSHTDLGRILEPHDSLLPIKALIVYLVKREIHPIIRDPPPFAIEISPRYSAHIGSPTPRISPPVPRRHQMIAAIHLVAHILFVLALVASAAALIQANDTSYFCGSCRPSHEHGLTPSHTRLPAVGVLSLIVVLSARALRRAVSTSFWSPPRGVSISTASNPARAFHRPSKFATSEPPNFPPPISQPSSPPPYIHPLSSPTSPPPSPSPNFSDHAFSKRSIHASNPIWPMPARNDRIAPVFNSNKPRELRKYFSDLEFLLARSHIADHTEMKCHATRFLDIDEQDLWESVPEFRDPAASFNSFTCAIFRLYPEADPERRYSVADLNNVVAEISPVQPLSRPRFLEFYRRFYRISTFLRSKDRLSAPEESRIFRRAIPPNIWELAQHRLHIKFPDTHPDDSYTLLDMCDAVDFVLIEKIFRSPPTLSTPELPHHSSEVRAPEAVSIQTPIAVLTDAVKQLTQCVPSQQPSHVVLDPDLQPSLPRPVASHPASPFAPSRTATCSYCSDPAHFIAQCPLVTADIRAGTCRRNAEGKVVLPSGTFVPRRIIGRDLKTRIRSWHAENSTHSAPVSHPRDITFTSSVPLPTSCSPRSASGFVAQHTSFSSAAVHAPTFNAQIPPFPLRPRVPRQPAPTSDNFTRNHPDIPSCASNSPMQFSDSVLPSTRSCRNNLVAVL